MLSNTDLQTSFRQGNVLSRNTSIASGVIFKYISGEHLWWCKNFCCETSQTESPAEMSSGVLEGCETTSTPYHALPDGVLPSSQSPSSS